MYKRRYHKKRLILAGAFAFAFTATFAFLATKDQEKTEAASLANFRAGNIISDAVMGDYNSMTIDQIQSFLKSKNACNQSADPGSIGAFKYENANFSELGVTYNRKYYFHTSKGDASAYYHVKDNKFVCLADETINGHSAAYHIWDAAQTFKINPKVLIVLLEKEQSLITDKFPNHTQYRGATGYGYPDDGNPDPRFFGFEAQIGNAANLFHTVLTGGWTNFPLGNNYVQYNPSKACGGSTVKIENLATSALYRYTPYQPNAAALAGKPDSCSAYGNRNFYIYYTDWFGDTQKPSGNTLEVRGGDTVIPTAAIPVYYQSHLQNIGWESGWKQDGGTTGTTGQSRRLEAVNIKITDSSNKDAHIYYQSHLQNIGWESGWKQDGETTGTTGQSRRLEAIKIKLDDASAKKYDIYYRPHIQDYGWLGWAKNGEPSGSEGLSKRLEALEIIIAKKGSAIPSSANQNNSRTFIK